MLELRGSGTSYEVFLVLKIWRDILFFSIAEGPNFITLDLIAGEISESPILILCTGFTEIHQEFNNTILSNACHSTRCPNRIPLHERRYHLPLFLFY
jgi:hypothetical protein